jgi:hypothetical protein
MSSAAPEHDIVDADEVAAASAHDNGREASDGQSGSKSMSKANVGSHLGSLLFFFVAQRKRVILISSPVVVSNM